MIDQSLTVLVRKVIATGGIEAMSMGVQPMARKRKSGGKEEPAKDEKSVRLDRETADKAAYLAARRGMTLGEFLTSLLKGKVDAMFAKEVGLKSEKESE
jgi:hypothetical protein